METFDDTDLVVGYNIDNDDLDVTLKGYLGLNSDLSVDWKDDKYDDSNLERKTDNGVKLEIKKKFEDFVVGGALSYDSFGASNSKEDLKKNGKKIGKVSYPGADKLGLEFYFKKDL